MLKRIQYLLLLISLQFCSLAGTKHLADIGFLTFLSRIAAEPTTSAVTATNTCLTYAKTVNSTSSAGTNNSYTCIYKPDSISMECVYTTPVTEDNTATTTKTDFFNSTEDFIQRTKNFAQSTVRYSQINKDISTNKFFQYDTSNRLIGIIQSDGTSISISEYDAQNRYTKGVVNPPDIICQVPFINSYDDTNLSFKQSIFFSKLIPSTNLLCNFLSTVVPDQTNEFFFDKDFLLTKRIFTKGSTVITETYTTVETAELCTGSDGAPFMAPIIQKFSSSGGAVGETVSITGVNFDTNPGGNSIQFANGTKTFGSTATNTSLSFIVPAGASSGQITVVNRYGTAKSKNSFYVYKYFIYAGNANSNSVSGLEVSVVDGSLMNPITLGIGNQPGNIIANPNGKYAYIINQGILAVNSVVIGTSNGFLSNIGSANAGNGARSAAISYDGKLLFVLNQIDNTISRFYIDSNTGSIVSIGTPTPTGVTGPNAITTHPSLPFLYVTGIGSLNVAGFIMDTTTGNLHSMQGSPFAISASPNGITIHPRGLFLYTANASVANSVSSLMIDQMTGALSGEISYSAVLEESLAMDSLGKYLYACSNTNHQINSYLVNQTDGSLTAIGFVSSNQCRTVVVDPSGKYAYATEDVGGVSGKINKFSIQPTGSLISNGSIALGTNNPKGLMISRTPQ